MRVIGLAAALMVWATTGLAESHETTTTSHGISSGIIAGPREGEPSV